MSERRALDPAERMVDVFDRASTLNFSIVARVRGVLTAERLEHALRRLERRHPLLCARVERTEAGAVFVMGEAKPNPLHVHAAPAEAWREHAEKTLEHRVWADDGHRAELIWLKHAAEDSTLILLLHHLVSDGSSGMIAMRDLVRLAADPELELAPVVSPGPARFYPRGHGSWRWKLRTLRMLFKSMGQPKPRRIRSARGADARSPRRVHLARLELGRADSSVLHVCARHEGATIHGVICAAFARAVAGELGEDTVIERLLHPIDLRRYTGASFPEVASPGEAVGYYVSSVETGHAVDRKAPLGALAREITQAIRDAKRDHEPLMTAPIAGPMLTRRSERKLGDLPGFRDFVEGKLMVSSFSLSNLGPLEALGVTREARGLELVDLFFVAAGSVLATLGGTVTSFEGSLTVTVGWVSPQVSREAGERVVAGLERELRSYLERGSEDDVPSDERAAG